MARQYTLHRGASASAPQIDYAAELNPQQCAAVTASPGPTLVIAGAGSGKTRTLTYRVAYLIENGVSPQNILLLTFTNKAAREMLDRVAGLIPNDLVGLWGGTFHSIGNRILRRHPVEAGFAPGFSIMDREDAQDLMDTVLTTIGIDKKDKRFPKSEVIGDVLSFSLNTGRSIDEVLVEKYPHFLEFAPQFIQAREKYEVKKRDANVMDFDDLLEKTLRLLRNNESIREHYQRQFQFILVDEYQDTNHIQSDFIDILGERHGNVMVVGDDAQSIYSWRGADFTNILEFPKRYPKATTYKIETNYRSVPEVLSVANAAIANNVNQFRKNLVSARESNDFKPAFVPLNDSSQQAQFVAQRILELNEEDIDLNDIAIVYRAHFHSMEVQMELTRRGIPFQITSGLRFFEQAHIKDVAAFLKYAVNPRDEVAFKRMVRLLPGIGARSAESLWNEASAAIGGDAPVFSKLHELKVPAKAKKAWDQLVHTLEEITPNAQPVPPAEMLRSVVEAVYDDYAKVNFTNYEQRREDLQTLTNFSRQFKNAAEFLDQLALLTNLENEAIAGRDETDVVTLTSVHQAKGLEWKIVFVIWMTDGMFPSHRSLERDESLEEERRLFYVAITRAKDELYLTYPQIRLGGGYGDMMQRPSRFLLEVPGELLEEWNVGSVW
jgi:ATP-dependent DNA helicase UvrD/PcrA